MVVGLALVVAVVGIAATVTILVSRLRDDATDRVALRRLMAASDDLELALLDERSMAGFTMIGQEELAGLPVEDNAAARAATDAALADYERAVADQEDEARALLDPVLDALGELAALRSDVDGHPSPSPGDMRALDASEEVTGRYGEMIDAVLGGDRDVLVSISDAPDVITGVELLEEGHWQIREIPGIATTLLTAGTSGPLDEPETVTAVSEFTAQLTATRGTVMDVADGTLYEPMAQQLDAELEAAGLETVLQESLDQGAVDIPRLIEAAPSATRAWQTFLSRVEADVMDAAGIT